MQSYGGPHDTRPDPPFVAYPHIMPARGVSHTTSILPWNAPEAARATQSASSAPSWPVSAAAPYAPPYGAYGGQDQHPLTSWGSWYQPPPRYSAPYPQPGSASGVIGPRTAAALDNASISASRPSSLSPTLDSISAKLGAPSVSVSKKRKVPADTPCLDPADLPKKHCASHQDLSRSSEPDVRTLSGPSSSLDAGPPAMHSQTPSTERPSSKLLPPAAPTVEPSSVPPDTPRQPTLSVDDMSPSTLVPTADLPATRAPLDAPPVADEGPTLSKAARRRARFAQQCVKDRPTRDSVADKPTRDPAAAETAPPAHVPDRSGSLEPGEIATPAVPLKLGAGKARAARMARVRERLEAERDARAAECAQFKAERDARAAECAQLEAERDAQSNACAQLVAERDARAAECAQLEAERDARSMECAQLTIVRDTRAAEYAQIMQERDTLLRAHERAEAERDTSAARTRELEEALRELGVDVPEQPAGTHALASGDCTPREVSDDLSGLTAERDRLAKEYLLLSTQRRRLKGELARTGTERDALRAEALSWQEKAQEAETTQRTTQGERDALRQDCARLETHLADAIAEHEAVTHFAHTISTARDATMAERDIVLAERDAAVAERNAVRVERDVARAEQDVLAAKLCAAVVERDEARAAVAAACKTAAATAMASACEELLRLREALDAVVHQAAAERGDSERLRAEHGNAAAAHVSALADLRAELNASRSAEQTRLVAEFDAVRAAHHIAHSNLQNELRRTSAERDAFAQEVKTFKVEQNIMRLEHDAACAGRDDALAQLKEVQNGAAAERNIAARALDAALRDRNQLVLAVANHHRSAGLAHAKTAILASRISELEGRCSGSAEQDAPALQSEELKTSGELIAPGAEHIRFALDAAERAYRALAQDAQVRNTRRVQVIEDRLEGIRCLAQQEHQWSETDLARQARRMKGTLVNITRLAAPGL